MPSAARLVKKEKYDEKLCSYLDKYSKAFLVHADNVGSRLFMDMRAGLRPNSVILMGKNSMMRRSIKLYCERKGDNSWLQLGDMLVGNVGIVFTDAELTDVRDKIGEYKVPAPARVGAIAPCDVCVEAGNTGMDPSQTNFFQTLNIATKINKGTVEIISDQTVVKKGEKVNSSESILLAKLKIMPFTYGLEIKKVYADGSLFDLAVLDLTDDDMVMKFCQGVAKVAALSIGANYPTLAAVPHHIINGYKNVLAISLSTEYTFDLAQKVKDYLANPSAFASAAPTSGGGGGAAAPAAKAPEPEEEEEEEEMEFDLFD